MTFSARRYSQHARHSLALARRMAEDYHHAVVDTDHLLIGIWREEGSLGYQVLQDFDVPLHELESTLADLHPPHGATNPPYTDALNAVLTYAIDESYWLGHHYIGTEHFLLGLVRVGGGKALQQLDISGNQIRQRVRRLVNDGKMEVTLNSARRMASLSELSRRVLNAATQKAKEQQRPAAGLEHLLYVMARERRSMATRLLLEMGLNQTRLFEDIGELPPDGALSAAAFNDVVDTAVDQAELLGTHYTGTDHLLLAMTIETMGRDLLLRYGVNVDELKAKLQQHFKK
jgi:ATP-dependent Clp protease ATP-binding subunit ClpA